MSVMESMSTLGNLTFRSNGSLDISRNVRKNEISETFFVVMCIILITLCVLVHLSLLFWVFYNVWKITLQRSVTIQEKNKDNDFESEDLSTNRISDSEELQIAVNPTIVVYKVHNSTTEIFSCHQSIGINCRV